MGKRRVWTDYDKATALAALEANDFNVRRTARQLDIPKSTLAEWAKGQYVPDAADDVRTLKKNQLADELEAVAYQLVGSLPDKIEDATLQQTATSIGIIIDKMRLLRGEPTEIINQPADFERLARLMEIYDLARARRDRGDSPNGHGSVVDSTARPTDRRLSQ